MGEYRLSEEAETALDDIWLYIVRDSGSAERATKVIDGITGQFWLLAAHPYTGRRRDHDLLAGLRSFPIGNYVIIYQIEANDVVEILHVVDGRRDIPALLREDDEE